MHRHLHAQERRNRYPESRLWETEAGHVWLRLLVWAVLYFFGLECGVGGDKLSRFFKLIRIDTHVGVSVYFTEATLQSFPHDSALFNVDKVRVKLAVR